MLTGGHDLSPHAFETALSLRGADGQYQLELDRTWEGQPGNVWGGFLLAVVLRAAGLTATATRPVSAASQFLRPAAIGEPLDINVVSLRRGRTSELLAVSVGQAGKTVVEAQIRATDGGSGPICEPRQPPTLVDPLSRPLAGEAMRADGTEPPNILAIWDMRAPEFGDATGGDPEAWFWARLGPAVTYDNPFLEAARYALSLDSHAPAVLHRLGAWGPGRREIPWGFSNLDSLIHFHQPSGTDWVYAEYRVLTGSDGLVSTQAQAWSSEGNLLATAMSQVAFFPLRPGGS